MNEADVKRFANFVGDPDENGCVMWLGAWTGPGGYGAFSLNGRNGRDVGAHRVAWEIVNGPIPDGLFVLHTCNNKWCVACDHLFLGTAQDNTDDMIMKGRNPFGERNGQAKLIEDQARQIYKMAWDGAWSLRQIADMFLVDKATVLKIKHRRIWKHLWEEEEESNKVMSAMTETETLATGEARHG
jgi:hypothetical protein